MAFEYKCVAGPTIVAVKNAKARDQAVKAFEDIMNIEAAEGWEYVGIDEFHISEPVGLLSRKRVFVPSKILVFRRVKASTAVVEALRMHAVTAHNKPILLSAETSAEPVAGTAPAQINQPVDPSQPSIRSIAANIKQAKE